MAKNNVTQSRLKQSLRKAGVEPLRLVPTQDEMDIEERRQQNMHLLLRAFKAHLDRETKEG